MILHGVLDLASIMFITEIFETLPETLRSGNCKALLTYITLFRRTSDCCSESIFNVICYPVEAIEYFIISI